MLIVAAILLGIIGLPSLILSGVAFRDDEPGMGFTLLSVGLIFVAVSVGCIIARVGAPTAPRCYAVIEKDGHKFMAPLDCP